MANEENDTAAGPLEGQVKGKAFPEASFKELGAEKDQEKFDANDTGVKMPQDSEKKLGK